MKKILFVLFVLFSVLEIEAQSPNQFKYQAVLRDASGNIIANQSVVIDIEILQGSATGVSVFAETHNTITTAQGLINLNIGSINNMSGIDWSADTYFVAITVNGNLMGTSRLLSVPYALQAKKASDYDETDPVFTSWDKNYADLINKPDIIDSITTVIDTTTQFVRKSEQWIKNGNNLYYNGGLIGIGVDNPTASLDIHDQVGNPFFNFVSQDNVFTIWKSNRINVDDYLIGIDGGNNRFIFANLTTAKFPLVFQNDKVGIGNLNPNAKLHVDNSDNNSAWSMLVTTGNNSGLLVDGNGSLAQNNRIMQVSNGVDTEFVVLGNGNVGIGTISPTQKLHVNGSIQVEGQIKNLSNPTDLQDAATKIYVDNKVAQHYVGELYGGGVVFYVYDHGQHGLIVSTEDLDGGNGVGWSATQSYIGTGAEKYDNGSNNTMAIVAQDNTSGYAATLCNAYTGGGQTDWYLPAAWELKMLYNSAWVVNKILDNDGNSATHGFNANLMAPTYGLYWSSTEHDSDSAIALSFKAANMQFKDKTEVRKVRAIRAF
jgi:hypothetical protein